MKKLIKLSFKAVMALLSFTLLAIVALVARAGPVADIEAKTGTDFSTAVRSHAVTNPAFAVLREVEDVARIVSIEDSAQYAACKAARKPGALDCIGVKPFVVTYELKNMPFRQYVSTKPEPGLVDVHASFEATQKCNANNVCSTSALRLIDARLVEPTGFSMSRIN